MIEFRRAIHKFPEGGFKEYETQKKIRAKLISFGIDPKDIRDCACTGLVVDIKGSGPAEKSK
jgi:metal-dependent amidase/aminoacylase/carboxypeptidase family protein